MTLGGINEGMSEFSETLSVIKPTVVELDQSISELRDTLMSANRLIQSFESGGGLASALLRDPALKNDVLSLVDKLERNGVLFYPREGGLFQKSSPPKTDSSSPREAETVRKPARPGFKKP